MSTELMIISAIVGIGLIMGLFYISHTIEQQKAKKALMINNMAEKAKHMQQLMDKIPGAYVSQELKLLILQQMQQRYQKIVQLTPGKNSYSQRLQSISQQIEDTTKNPAKTETPNFRNPQEAESIKAGLKHLSKLLEGWVNDGSLDASNAKQLLSKTQGKFTEANINYLISQADAAKAQNKYKVAVLNYEKAQAALQKRNHDNSNTDKINQLATNIQEVKDLIEKEKLESQKSASELTAGLKDISQEDDSWKKKYF